MTAKPLISIIVITYNSEKFIADCLDALERQTYRNFELILVDNNSNDLTCELLETRRQHFVRLEVNVGFAGGNNIGLLKAVGKYIILLNPDTIPQCDWLEQLVNGADDFPEVGICASKLVVYNTDLIDSAGDGCTTTARGFKRGERENVSYFIKQDYVFGACGGAMLVRREVIEEIGFLDDDFFLIYEDTDFCFRAQLAGWKCLFIPTAVVHHRVRSSIGDMTPFAAYYSIRNARYVWIKNMPFLLMVRFFHHKVIEEAGVFFYFVLKHHMGMVYLKATAAFFKALPKLIRKRRTIQQKRKVSVEYIQRILTSLVDRQILANKINKLFK